MQKSKYSLTACLLAISCAAAPIQEGNSQYVNPKIGASTSIGAAGIYHGLGKTYPGATVPFGMAQANPQTVTGGDNAPGYSDEHMTIEGFSVTQMSGTGWYGEMGNLLTMPTTGPLLLVAGDENDGTDGWRSPYDKASETATAGYYSTLLTRYDILSECTASPHCSAFRFSFPKGETARIQADLSRRVGGRSLRQAVERIGSRTLRGWMYCPEEGGGWGHGDGHVNYTLYFYIVFDRPIKNFGVWNGNEILPLRKQAEGDQLGFFAEFGNTGGPVEMTVGLSYCDLKGAQKNYRAEAAGKNFDQLCREAAERWNKALSVIDIMTDDSDIRTVFYTALYHTMLDPRDITDCDGRYWGGDGEIHLAEGFRKRTVFSGWDVFRSQFPLLTLLRPDVVSDMLNSLITLADESGKAYFERWELLNAYSGCMLGNPALSVLVDAYMKGIRDFDIKKAYSIAKNTSELFPGSQSSISEILEYSYTDWCLGVLARELGYDAESDVYLEKSLRYRNLFNPETGWFQPKDKEGNWIPYPPAGRLAQNFGCIESNPYQQGWFVPHDWDAFVQLLGGRQAALDDLESMFAHTPGDYSWNDYYNHANEPVHFVPYLFNRLGAPHRTQYWTRDICKNAYHNSVEGLVGNEDVGQMSAWYILSSIGLHPVCPGETAYELTSPVFDEITLHLPGGKDFRIVAEGTSSERPFIGQAFLNGIPVEGTSIDYKDIIAGGELRLQMISL